MILGQDFFEQNTKKLARALLGQYLLHDSPSGRTSGRIVETEAYLSKNDPACHAHRGKTKRNAVMFGPPGHCYVYLIYGMYFCFNVVSGKEGVGEAVLIRAVEPVEGILLMKRRRKVSELRNLTNGPGKLVLAMGINASHNGLSLTSGEIKLVDKSEIDSSTERNEHVTTTTRVGISAGVDLPLRYYLTGSPFVSKR